MSGNQIVFFENLLSDLVAFENVDNDMVNYLKNRAVIDGFTCECEENYMIFDTSSDVDVVIFTHLDVVPALEWDQAYKLKITNEGYYGRGVMDNKGPFSAIYTLLSNLDVKVRLFAGFKEETNFACIKQYISKHGHPKLGLVPDGKFPVICGEKGNAFFNLKLLNKEVEIEEMLNPPNVVPGEFKTSKCVYYGDNVHSSKCDIKNNCIYKFFEDMYPQYCTLLDTFSFEEDKLGTTTINPTVVKQNGNYIDVYFDVRFANICDLEDLSSIFGDVYIKKRCKYNYEKDIVDMLMNSYMKITNDNSPFRTSSGGTYSAFLENTYIYGFELIDQVSNVHIKDEYISKENIIKGYQIYEDVLLNGINDVNI